MKSNTLLNIMSDVRKRIQKTAKVNTVALSGTEGSLLITRIIAKFLGSFSSKIRSHNSPAS